MRAQYITVDEVSAALGISKSKSYQIIRSLNRELRDMGYITVSGKCPLQYFKQKFYGLKKRYGIIWRFLYEKCNAAESICKKFG